MTNEAKRVGVETRPLTPECLELLRKLDRDEILGYELIDVEERFAPLLALDEMGREQPLLTIASMFMEISQQIEACQDVLAHVRGQRSEIHAHAHWGVQNPIELDLQEAFIAGQLDAWNLMSKQIAEVLGEAMTPRNPLVADLLRGIGEALRSEYEATGVVPED